MSGRRTVTVYEVRSADEGLEGVFYQREHAYAYAAELAWDFAARTDVVAVERREHFDGSPCDPGCTAIHHAWELP